MRSRRRIVPIMLLALWPALGSAQAAGAESALALRDASSRGVGVVTTLTGTATVARAALPAPQPLRFKDDVFRRDRISTAERSIVRVLLGGKALVTVRELSSVTITEETGRSTVDLASGKIAMGVLRQRMRPGEVIEIRTPNAIAAIRGTVLVVELIREEGAGGAVRYTTRVHVLHGSVEVSDPNNPGAPPAQVGALESWSRTGSDAYALVPLAPAGAYQIFADLRSAPQITEGPSELMQAVTVREQARAVAVAEFLAPEIGAASGGNGSEPAIPTAVGGIDTPSFVVAPVTPMVTIATSPPSAPPSATSPDLMPSSPVPPSSAPRGSLGAGQSLMEVSGGALNSSDPTSVGLGTSRLSAASLLALGDGGQLNLRGTLYQDQDGVLDLHSDALRLSGDAMVRASGPGAFVDLAGTAAATTGSLLSASGRSLMELLSASEPLLRLSRGAVLTADRSLVDLSGGASVKLGQLVALTASSLTVKGHALSLAGGARLTVAGDLFRIAGGSTLTVTSGALLSLTGSSSLNVAGALVNFIGSGNTLSISNNLCGGACTMVGNLPVLVKGGGSISLANPILNLSGGNTLTIAPGSAVITVTGGAQVKQGP